MANEEKTLFTIYNNHVESCGEPPSLNNREGKRYYGYFENQHGEQWIFIYNYETETATLKGGDVQWPSEKVMTTSKPPYVMNEPEQLWLLACWKAATAHKETRTQMRKSKP